MRKPKKDAFAQIALTIFIIGASIEVLSIAYSSSILAIIGLSIFFWGAITLYIKPDRHIPLTLLNASTTSNLKNIERILSETNSTQKGLYLPPKYMKDLDSGLLYIPKEPNQPIPTLKEINQRTLALSTQNGIILTPPGLALSNLLEKELGTSFLKLDLSQLQFKLPKILTENLEITKDALIEIGKNKITLKISNNVLNDLCQETRKLPRTHKMVGCLLSSAIACALAKTTGKIVIIQKEEQNPRYETIIHYKLLED